MIMALRMVDTFAMVKKKGSMNSTITKVEEIVYHGGESFASLI